MTKSQAITKYVRISPRKARLAAALIRGLPAGAAEVQLLHSNMKAGRLLLKTLKSAIANAEYVHESRPEDLIVSEVLVNEGPRHKRSKARSRGSRSPIMKRTSHFTVKLSTTE